MGNNYFCKSLDELATAASNDELELSRFESFFLRLKEMSLTQVQLSLETILNNMNLAKNGFLTLGGLLLFGKNVQAFKPFCIIRAIHFYTTEINDEAFIDKMDCTGTLEEQLFIFKDRVQIISPGSLPNHLTVDNVINGNSLMRNVILASYGTKILQYTGIGSGIPRIFKLHPETTIENDKEGEQFTITLKRPPLPI